MKSEESELKAWALLQAARSLADRFPDVLNAADDEATVFHYDDSTHRVTVSNGLMSDADVAYSAETGWQCNSKLSVTTRHWLDLYLPVLGTARQPAVVIGHLGQSIDARIATTDGDAFFVTGEENRKHLHRLRSLCQAVIVGAGTAIIDNPRLTTRAVSGQSPVRVIIDPLARVPTDLTMMVDGLAPTVLLHAQSVALDELLTPEGCIRLVVPSEDDSLHPRNILQILARNGWRRIFVEGGGVTVSRFFNAGCLSRLQLAVAPVLVGDGTPALTLPGAATMEQAMRPPCRLYRMGEDVLWDFALQNQTVPENDVLNDAASPEGISVPAFTRLL